MALLESQTAQLLIPDTPRNDQGLPVITPPAPTPEMPQGSPQWWLLYLERVLAQQQARIRKADLYYGGKQDTVFISAKYRDAFGKLLQVLVENWMPLVVDALRERTIVTGFRMPQHGDPAQPPVTATEKGDPADLLDPFEFGAGDTDAWNIWQYNDLDAESQLCHSEAFIKGRAFALVNPFVDKAVGLPEITIEDASQMVTVYESGSRRKVIAALKMWLDLYGQVQATLYLPNAIYKFTRLRSIGSPIILPDGISVGDWGPREVDNEPWPLPNPLGVVPVVPFDNRPRLLSIGESELAQVMSTQDAINKLLADLMVASEFAAWPQRWLTGYKPDVDPITGTAVSPFESALNRVWNVEGENAKFGQFQAADLANYTNAVKAFLESLSARTRIPTHYFGLVGQWPSGEALQAAEAGLVSKALEKMLFLGNSWERVLRIAFLALKDPRAKIFDSETLWMNPRMLSPAAVADAAVKKSQIGVTWTQLMIDVGYSSQEIGRMQQERAIARAKGVEAEGPVTVRVTEQVPGTTPSGQPAPSGDASEPAPTQPTTGGKPPANGALVRTPPANRGGA